MRRKFMLDIPKVCQKKTLKLFYGYWGRIQYLVKIQKIFNLGWDRANSFIDMMNELGLVGELYAKFLRKVLLHSFEEVPDELLEWGI